MTSPRRAPARPLVLGLIAALAVSILPGAPIQSVRAAPAELFFSEYIEGSSNNKALEIFNGTGATVDLLAGGYNVQMFFNGLASAGLTVNLTGSTTNGDVYVLAQSAASATILAQADQTNGAGWFNGDDAVILRKGTTVIDAIGQIGLDPGTEWGTGLTSTMDNTLRRKPAIQAGDTNGADAFDPAVQWDGFATDTFGGLGSHTIVEGDTAPSVTATSPANASTGFGPYRTIDITFSEPVNVTGSWFSIECASTGTHTASVSGGPTGYTLDPDADFGGAEVCTVKIIATQVSDTDLSDPPDNMAADFEFSFTTMAACGSSETAIHDVQGPGSASPIVGQQVEIEGVIVGDFQPSTSFNGFHVQDEDVDVDPDPMTSEGIFVFEGASAVAVDPGDTVRVAGGVVEFLTSGVTLTELSSVTGVLVCASGSTVTPAQVTLPFADLTFAERFEGMLVETTQALTVTETFTLGRFGELVLSSGGRLRNPTNVVEPGAPAIALQAANNLNRIVLDDGDNTQNLDPTVYPAGGLSASNTLRVGDTVLADQFVLEQRFGVYRLQPVEAVQIDATNPRPEAPASVGGGLKVAALNVLNYFTTLDAQDGGCGPTGALDCRGANTIEELNRQRAKTVAEIVGLDADILGLMEIQNDNGATTADLVAAVNADPGTLSPYEYINTGTIGTDAIKLALLYRPAVVTPIGAHKVLTSAFDPDFIDNLNRPALAQTFDDTNGGRLTVVVNHLKSKGSDCNAVGDPDAGDGQGNCNGVRTDAAEVLVDWIATDPTESGDRDVLVIGDLNSYAKEDPIDVFVAAGYTNLIDEFLGDEGYSFVFQGQSGYLDHALASPTLAAQVAGVTEWHINADEPTVLDYNVEFKSPNHVNTLYAPNAYRSSDHDPLLVGIDLLNHDFSGFLPPVDNPPVVNTVNAGRTIPMKFTLSGDLGLDVLFGTPTAMEFACDSGTPMDEVTTTTAGDQGLTFDPATGEYTYAWKTDRAWAGQCRTFAATFDDGAYRTADFRFR